MKYLLLFFIFMVLLWQWRHARAPKVKQAQRKGASGPVDMVRCAHCGLHLPASDAVQGASALYCSTEHRLAQEP